jgi:hypothetical protein
VLSFAFGVTGAAAKHVTTSWAGQDSTERPPAQHRTGKRSEAVTGSDPGSETGDGDPEIAASTGVSAGRGIDRREVDSVPQHGGSDPSAQAPSARHHCLPTAVVVPSSGEFQTAHSKGAGTIGVRFQVVQKYLYFVGRVGVDSIRCGGGWGTGCILC